MCAGSPRRFEREHSKREALCPVPRDIARSRSKSIIRNYPSVFRNAAQEQCRKRPACLSPVASASSRMRPSSLIGPTLKRFGTTRNAALCEEYGVLVDPWFLAILARTTGLDSSRNRLGLFPSHGERLERRIPSQGLGIYLSSALVLPSLGWKRGLFSAHHFVQCAGLSPGSAPVSLRRAPRTVLRS